MKKIILLSGPYGVGKTTLANNLVNNLNNAVMLDGEWVWFQGNNWNFTKENKDMALDNICYLLNNFLKNSNFETIVFSWILHKQEDHDFIINSLNSKINFIIYDISLLATEDVLRERLKKRIVSKATEFNAFYSDDLIQQALDGSLKKLSQINKLNNIKLDVSDLNQEQVLDAVLKIVGFNNEKNKIYIKH